MAAATADNLVLNIGDMIDMAIGTPEVGVVDFNMLQTVLHCLAQQQQILTKLVEVRGVAAPTSPARDVATVNVMEFAVGTDGQTPVQKEPSAPNDTILVVERVKKIESAGLDRKRSDSAGSQTIPSKGEAPAATGPSSAAAAPSPAAMKAAVESKATKTAGTLAPGATGEAGQPQTTAGAPGLDGLSLVTYSKFNLLENSVAELQKRVYGSIPKNEEILEEVRSQTNIKAIQDMWTNLNVSARLEAAEAGIGKLSSLVQDVINETANLQDIAAKAAAAPAEPTSGRGTPGADISAVSVPTPQTAPSGVTEYTVPAADVALKTDLEGITDFVNDLRYNLDNLTDLFYSAMKQMPVEVDLPPAPEPGVMLDDVMASRAKTEEGPRARAEESGGGGGGGGGGGVGGGGGGVGGGGGGVGGGGGGVGGGGGGGVGGGGGGSGGGGVGGGGGGSGGGGGGGGAKDRALKPRKPRSAPSGGGGGGGIDGDVLEVMERLNDLEKRVEACCETLGKGDGVISDQLNSFQDQLEYLQKQVAGLTTLGAGSSGLSPDLIKDLQGMMQLFQTVQDMQDQMKQVHDTALQLAAEKEDRKHNINVLLEQIELLKTIKLDREDMAEAMAEKADLRMLARKVSHDQFELACDDLSRGLEHALGKLTMQEALWQQALDDIQREIETKLDKLELSPLKEFFNSKLKALQDSLKQMASLRREAEAAGTKRKLMRDVNCLSCDANAVMATEAQPSIPVPKPFPAALSMKPYLSYELDAIRKTQGSNLQQRNMHDWENIDKQMGQPKQQFKIRSSADKHLCNRYCGGSHTTTTPAQRVARLGHFIKQWGPDVLPLSSGFAAGDDGRMYRVQGQEGKPGPGGAVDTTCSPNPLRRTELPQVSSDRSFGEECKCLNPPPRK